MSVAKTKSNEITLIRVYDAPVKHVWEAWTDPNQAAQWWGPRGFTITTHSHDLRPGGRWNYTMHGPDGINYENDHVYHKVEKHSRLVYDHGGNDERPPLFRVTVSFHEEGSKTTMDMTMTLPSDEAATETRKFIKQANGESTWDRLGEYLVKQETGRELFIINRSFDAPIARVYEMWVEPTHLKYWLPPTGAIMEFLRSEIKVGKSTFYFMTMGTTKMFGRAQYIELTKPHRIVYMQQFCDVNEKVARHPMAQTWPETMHTTITLAVETPERTRITIAWEPHGSISTEELLTFVNGRASMTGGWTGSLDKLEAHLAT